MRKTVANWMLEVIREQNSQAEVFCLSMNILDRFLSQTQIHRSQLQLLGAVCILIASKIREPCPIPGKSLIIYTDYSITAEELKVCYYFISTHYHKYRGLFLKIRGWICNNCFVIIQMSSIFKLWLVNGHKLFMNLKPWNVNSANVNLIIWSLTIICEVQINTFLKIKIFVSVNSENQVWKVTVFEQANTCYNKSFCSHSLVLLALQLETSY